MRSDSRYSRIGEAGRMCLQFTSCELHPAQTVPVDLVPGVRIERTTYRLQGGCSTPELNRPRLTPFSRILKTRSVPGPRYLILRNVGFPPPEGFFGSDDGAGSAVGGLALMGAASDSALDWMLGLAPSVSKVMPCPVS